MTCEHCGRDICKLVRNTAIWIHKDIGTMMCSPDNSTVTTFATPVRPEY